MRHHNPRSHCPHSPVFSPVSPTHSQSEYSALKRMGSVHAVKERMSEKFSYLLSTTYAKSISDLLFKFHAAKPQTNANTYKTLLRSLTNNALQCRCRPASRRIGYSGYLATAFQQFWPRYVMVASIVQENLCSSQAGPLIPIPCCLVYLHFLCVNHCSPHYI